MIDILYKKVENLPGYKIKNSHFRIGAKIHISDFYYAKRFFQNNFFASRFAFMLAREIRSQITKTQLDAIEQDGLTLISYGIYSELLISLVEKFLKSGLIKIKKVNHNLVEDNHNVLLIKKQPIYPNCIIIVPIASTFSTSMKIEEMLVKKKQVTFLTPHYNILYVAHQSEHIKGEPMEKEFGWSNKDLINREITLNWSNTEGEEFIRIQKYLISLPSEWQKIESCASCFPHNKGKEDLLKEKPLFETDRTSVTPTSIFDFPRAGKIPGNELSRPFILTPAMLRYGHHIKNDWHFFYRIDTELFLEKNEKEFRRWLGYLLYEKKIRYTDSDHILLISSCHYSNTNLLNIVNEVMFSSGANIIHFDPGQDYIQNFELIYGAEVCAADKIIFVDDSLKTGKTLSKINEFIRYTLSQKNKRKSDVLLGVAEGISDCIFLINKAQHFTLYALSGLDNQASTIHSFANLHLFTSLTYEDHPPLTLEQERYKMLTKECFLDSLKLHFTKQAKKLNVSLDESNDPVKRERHLRMLEATHRLYQFFNLCTEAAPTNTTWDNFVILFYEHTSIPFTYRYKNESSGSIFSMREAALLKVLTQSPFTQFEPLKRPVFGWVLALLDAHINTLHLKLKSIEPGYTGGLPQKITLVEFTDLKFLCRRVCLMNSNYLISEKFLTLIRDLYASETLVRLATEINTQYNKLITAGKGKLTNNEIKDYTDTRDKKITEITEFHVFIVAQIKELLLQNEIRSIILERLIKNMTGNAAFRQVLRILRMENATIIQKFFDLLVSNPKWCEIYPYKDPAAHINPSLEPLEDFLKLPAIRNNPKYRYVNQYFKMTEQKDLVNNKPFLNYLWLKNFIEHDTGLEKSLNDKTHIIFDKLGELLSDALSDRIKSNSGAFLIIRDSRERVYLVYNKNGEKKAQLDSSTWNNEQDKFIECFMNGEHSESKTYMKSIVELRRDVIQKKWIDLYSITESEVEENLSYDFLPLRDNRLILLRLSRRDTNGKEKIQGLIGFYFDTAGHDVSFPFIQYLVLLKSALSDFVEKHHQNNEFSDWLVSENNRKLALLAGHGKYMLQKIAIDHRDFREIILNLEHLQLIFLVNESSVIKNEDDQIKETFDKFYHVEGKSFLSSKDINYLAEMAEKIYDLEEIERSIKIKPNLTFEAKDFSFAFNLSILKIIMFELFVNAKKNRWHFIDEEIDGLDRNDLEIRVETSVRKNREGKEKKALIIHVVNTCPRLEANEMTALKGRGSNIKKDDSTAGTALIKKLVYDILQGDINFHLAPVRKDANVHRFTVTVTLFAMEATK